MGRLSIKHLVDGRACAVAAAVAGVATMGLAGTALAAPSTIPKTFIGIKLVAAPHTVNHVTIVYGVEEQLSDGFQRDAQFVTDTAGLIVIPGENVACDPPVGNTTTCPDTGTGAGVPNGSTGTGEYPTIQLGDLNDTFTSDNVGDLGVSGGPGNDTMLGGSRPIISGAFDGEPGSIDPSSEGFSGDGGNDVLKGFDQPDGLDGGPGNDKLDGGAGDDDLLGGKGKDLLVGGPGNDDINARDGLKDKRISCGPGKDRATVDKVDPKPVGCEIVKRG